jgi:hypothetical protein
LSDLTFNFIVLKILKNISDRYIYIYIYICPADNATAGSLGRRRAGQLRFGFVAVSAGHIVYIKIIINIS